MAFFLVNEHESDIKNSFKNYSRIRKVKNRSKLIETSNKPKKISLLHVIGRFASLTTKNRVS